MADVKREKELAEKRKNDPPLDLSQDHPVRKLISRFKKFSENKDAPNNTTAASEMEKGEPATPNNISKNAQKPSNQQNSLKINGGATRVINVTEKTNNNKAAAATKWGKFLAGSGGAANASDAAASSSKLTAENKTDTPNTSKVPVAPTHPPPKPSAPPKPASRWGKMFGKSEPAPIKEVDEEEMSTKIKGIPRVDAVPPGAKNLADEAPLTQRDIVCSVGGSSNLSAHEQHLISSLYDIKLEIKEEIETLSQKMTKIDLHIGDILKMFTPHSSPFQSHTPTSLSSHTQSSSTDSNSCSTSTGSNSIVTSPKGSLPSSPHHQHHHNKDHLDTVAGGNKGPAPAVPDAKHKQTDSSQRQPTGSGSRPSSRSCSPQDGSESRSGSASGSASSSRRGSGKRKKPHSKKKVAPSDFDDFGEPVTPGRDEDGQAHVKDRDLDII